MASTEQGGNQPMRTLFIGGPKHGQLFNLAEGQTEYELVESTVLAGVGRSPSDPRYEGNIYSYDQTLSALLKRNAAFSQVFSHAVISDDRHGAEILPKMRRAAADLEAAKDALKATRAALDAKQDIVSDRNREIGDLHAQAIDVAAKHNELLERLRSIRIVLEGVGVGVTQAVAETGYDYESVIGKKPA